MLLVVAMVVAGAVGDLAWVDCWWRGRPRVAIYIGRRSAAGISRMWCTTHTRGICKCCTPYKVRFVDAICHTLRIADRLALRGIAPFL